MKKNTRTTTKIYPFQCGATTQGSELTCDLAPSKAGLFFYFDADGGRGGADLESILRAPRRKKSEGLLEQLGKI